MSKLYLKLVDETYKDMLEEYRNSFIKDNEIIHGGAGMEKFEDIEKWIEFNQLNRSPETVAIGLEPASTFMVLKDDKMVGIIDIRHSLNDYLFRIGGHIGYSIGREYRRKGYGKEMLKLGLIEAKKLFIDRVLITCNSENIGSRKIILSCGGVFEDTYEEDGELTERYWIGI